MKALAIGGMADHAHLLLTLPSSLAVAIAMREIKSGSSHWMHVEGNLSSFEWQEGYGAFSVSSSQVEVVKGYIENQEEHHRKRNFEQEFVTLLRNCGIEYDERYVFG